MIRRLFWPITKRIQRAAHALVTGWIWGERCSEYQEGCATCEHWREHDWIFE